MNQQRTRAAARHCVLGESISELPQIELPTKLQIAKHFLHLKETKYSGHKELVPVICQSVIKIWDRAGIPQQPLKTIKTKLSRLMEECSETTKHAETDKSKMFVQSLDKLFDIASCQCKNFDECACEKDKKIPRRERAFLMDQRTAREMVIAGVDKKTTEVMKRRQVREDRLNERQAKEKRRKDEARKLVDTASSEQSDNNDESDFCDSESDSSQQRNMVKIPTVAQEADRYGVSNRAAAALCTATLVDYGIINPNDETNVIDKQKVWRARQELRRELRERHTEDMEQITGLFFDGKKDMTLMKEKVGDKWYSTQKWEDHYVLVGEPGTFYLQHLTLQQGTGAAIAEALHCATDEMEITSHIAAVGADSTPVNTGQRNGAIHLLECRLGRPLQWFICYLHLNELPFRHLCKHFLGPSEGPTQWKGQLGKDLHTCHSLPLSPSGFKKIPCRRNPGCA